MKNEFSSIGEIVKILKGSKAPEVFDKPRPGAYPYLQIEDLRPNATPKYTIDKDGTLAKKTDVLIAWDGANAGTIGFDLEGYIGSTIAILRPIRDDIHSPYLAYFLRSKFKDIQENTTGATIPHVSRDYLESLKIPLPPLEEQKRIASLLARADRLRQLRRTARALADSLLQSVFLEMFGDVAVNPKGWDYEIVDELCELVRGSSPRPQGDPRFFGGNVPRLMVADITRDGMYVTPNIDSLTELGAKQSRPMKAGDVVMVVSGIVGLPAILNIDACIHDGFVGFRNLDKRISSTYFYFLLLFMQKENSKQAAGAIWQNLTTDLIREWKIPLPPLSLQEEFARVVARVEALRRRMEESARQAEGLFQALLAEAFA